MKIVYKELCNHILILLVIIGFLFCFKNFQIPIFGTETSNSQSEDSLVRNKTDEKEKSEITSEEAESSEAKNDSYEIYHLLSDAIKQTVDSINSDKLSKFSKDLDDLYNYLSGKYFDQKVLQDIADMSIIDFIIKNELLQTLKKDMLSGYIQTYKYRQKSRYDDEKYNSMDAKSQEFALTANKTGNCPPENVIIMFNEKALNNYPVTYDENILISLDDAINILGINPEIEYMDNNANIIIKFDGNSIVIVPGGNFIDINDKRVILETYVLNIEGVTYVPVGILDYIGCKVIQYEDSAVIY